MIRRVLIALALLVLAAAFATSQSRLRHEEMAAAYEPEAPAVQFNTIVITRAEYGAAWPFKLDTMELACSPPRTVTARVPNNIRVGINVPGRAIWPPATVDNVLARPDANLYPILDRGLTLCNF